MIVQQEKKRMMHKVAVVFFLSRMEEYLTTPVPLLVMETNLGAHLMLSTLDNGQTVVRKIRWLFSKYFYSIIFSIDVMFQNNVF